MPYQEIEIQLKTGKQKEIFMHVYNQASMADILFLYHKRTLQE